MTTAERFWAKVVKTDTCWIWQAALDSDGYGLFRVGRRLMGAHRLSYEMANGPMHQGLETDHLCRNPPCVNPSHLEAVTKAENQRRGNAALRQLAKTHCPKNHPYSGSNLYVYRNKRGCRACRAEALRRYQERTVA